jgi:signal transduction histidine kinase
MGILHSRRFDRRTGLDHDAKHQERTANGESLIRIQGSAARIAGAIAHELNNPLQGILSLIGIFARECAGDEPCQIRLEQIRSGLARVARIVESLSAVYENLPRVPDRTTAGVFSGRLEAAMHERQLRAEITVGVPADSAFECMVPEVTRLIADAYSLQSPAGRTVRVVLRVEDDLMVLTCEREPDDPSGVEPWHGLDEACKASGMAVLVNEMTELGGGRAEFRFDHTSLSGVRLFFRTRM